MASLTSSFSRLALRSSASRQLAGRALSTSAPRAKPAPSSATSTPVLDLPIETIAVASSSSTPLPNGNRVKAIRAPTSPLGQPKNVRELTRTGRARQLLSWTWLEPEQLVQLTKLTEAGASEEKLPTWLEKEHETAKSFCEARSRLWVPSTLPEGANAESVEEWLEQERATLQQSSTGELAQYLPVAEQNDAVLKRVWKSMTKQQRENALIECRFSSLRKLGWRTGYSAGYPLPEESMTDDRRALLDQIKSGGAEALQALISLQSMDDEVAWDSWLRMSPAERSAEEAEAWAQRDRSVIYLDNSPSNQIVGRNFPRWYETPQRAGQLVYLPNFIIRLVRNYTPRGKPYDPWKATFRVPLNLHKHALRSFLLSVYGLRTTWIRSMIYRAPVRRGGSFRTQKTTGSVGTWKKVEVGLLEPFVYPAMSERFKKDVLLEDEVKREQTRTQMNLSGTRRWRGGRPVQRSLAPAYLQKNHYPEMEQPLTQEQQEAKLVAQIGSPAAPKDPQEPSRSKGLYNLTTRSGTHPSKRHSNILKVLNGLRKERQRMVEERAEQLKEVATPPATESRAQ